MNKQDDLWIQRNGVDDTMLEVYQGGQHGPFLVCVIHEDFFNDMNLPPADEGMPIVIQEKNLVWNLCDYNDGLEEILDSPLVSNEKVKRLKEYFEEQLLIMAKSGAL